jgi:hypothetical protein
VAPETPIPRPKRAPCASWAELRDRWDADRMGLGWDEARPAVRDTFETDTATEWSDPGNPLA